MEVNAARQSKSWGMERANLMNKLQTGAQKTTRRKATSEATEKGKELIAARDGKVAASVAAARPKPAVAFS